MLVELHSLAVAVVGHFSPPKASRLVAPGVAKPL